MADPKLSFSWARLPQWVLIAMLALGLGLPGVFSVVRPSSVRDFGAENRYFRSLPKSPRTRQELLAYARRFDQAFNDRFGLRPELIRWHNRSLLRVLGLSPLPNVVLGSDRWLYLSELRVLDYHVTRSPMPPDAQAAWHDALEARRLWLEQLGALYLVVIVPDKYTVYPEHLPARLRGSEGANRLDALLSAFPAGAGSPLLDLRPALLGAKSAGLVFQRTDTHWSELGAYQGYRAIMARLAVRWPGLTPLPEEGFAVLNEPRLGGDLARMLDYPEFFLEDAPRLEPRQPLHARQAAPPRLSTEYLARQGKTWLQATSRADGTIPSMLVFHDSFGDFLMPFLSEHAAKTVYCRGAGFNPALVLTEQPQVVLQIMSERALTMPIPQDDPLFFGLGFELPRPLLEEFKALVTAPPEVLQSTRLRLRSSSQREDQQREARQRGDPRGDRRERDDRRRERRERRARR